MPSARRREFQRGYNGIEKQERAQLFSLAADIWLEAKQAHLALRSVTIEKINLKHLKPFGGMLLCDIGGDSIAAYQRARLREEAAPKTINLEVGTVRAILRKHRMCANVQPDVKMLRVREDVGGALTQQEETALLTECRNSRSRSLYIAVELALGTCMRYSEIRLLQWKQIDLSKGNYGWANPKRNMGKAASFPLTHVFARCWSFGPNVSRIASSMSLFFHSSDTAGMARMTFLASRAASHMTLT